MSTESVDSQIFAFLMVKRLFRTGFRSPFTVVQSIQQSGRTCTGPLARPFAVSLAPLTLSLAPHSLLHSRASLREFVGSIAQSLFSELAVKRMSRLMAVLPGFFSVPDHSVCETKTFCISLC